MSTSSASQDEKVLLAARAEAAAWITRLHGPDRTEETEAGFRRWLAERSENAIEFEGLTEIWALVGGLPARGAPRVMSWECPEHRPGARSNAAPRIWAWAATVLLTIGALFFGAYRFWLAPVYTTAIGEQRIVLLRDGTRVTLNSNTRLRGAYRAEERRVQLEQGEAFFEVVHDARRPFVVSMGEHRVTALGTSFVVRYDRNRTAVTLVEGKVAVTASVAAATSTNIDPARVGTGSASGDQKVPGEPSSTVREQGSAEAPPVILQPGEQLILAAGQMERLENPRVEALLAWRRGEVMLDDTPLNEAVAEMNRHNETPIIIDDADIAKLLVSGLFHTGDSEGFSLTVARLHGLEVERKGHAIHLKSR